MKYVSFCYTFVLGVLLGVSGLHCFQSAEVPSHLITYPDLSRHFIFVRGNRWSLEIEGPNDLQKYNNTYGTTDCSTKTIYLEDGLGYLVQRDALLHELLHAGTCDKSGKTHNKFWNSTTEADHEGIYKISDYLSTLLHDNPELSHFLAGNFCQSINLSVRLASTSSRRLSRKWTPRLAPSAGRKP
jgi:hypothetical protein